MAAPGPLSYEFDVALSFAGEDRAYAYEVASALKEGGLRVFYDDDFLAETWGENLIEYFEGVYRVRSRFAMMFVSAPYAKKAWTRLERRSALARAMQDKAAYVLPVRLDDTELDGLLPTVGYVDARRVGIDGIVGAITRKIAAADRGVDPGAVTRVPRSKAELSIVLRDRPEGWEYLLFGGDLHQRMADLEERYRDHEMGYAERTGERVPSEDFLGWLQTKTAEATHRLSMLETVLSPTSQERAFGAPGVAGDPDRILHLARRATSIYVDLLEWAAGLRGAIASPREREPIEALAKFMDGPIRQYRNFVTSAIEQIDEIPAAVAAGQQLRITLAVAFGVSEVESAAFDEAMRRYRKAQQSSPSPPSGEGG